MSVLIGANKMGAGPQEAVDQPTPVERALSRPVCRSRPATARRALRLDLR